MNLSPSYDDPYRHLNQWWTYFKNGKPQYLHYYPVTWLRKCDHCGFVGSPKRVAYRSECYVPDWPNGSDIELCMPCWNRFRVLVHAYRMVGECKYLINKMRRLAVVPKGVDQVLTAKATTTGGK